MSPTDDPGSSHLQAAIKWSAEAATPWVGVTFRSAAQAYAAATDQLSGEGSKRHGGRWNPVGVAAVYSSLTPETAMAEALAHVRYYQLPIHRALPRLFVALRFELSQVLDLSSQAALGELGVTPQEIDCDWRRSSKMASQPMTQALGQAAAAAGVEAIIVPSVADREGKNLVVFRTNLLRSSIAEVIDAPV